MEGGKVDCTDPSRLVRPESVFANKPLESFRIYDAKLGGIQERVKRTYTLMHTHQTVEFVQQKVYQSLINR